MVKRRCPQVLDYAYWNNYVSYPTMSKATLKKYEKKGWIKPDLHSRRLRYELTRKGLVIFKKRCTR